MRMTGPRSERWLLQRRAAGADPILLAEALESPAEASRAALTLPKMSVHVVGREVAVRADSVVFSESVLRKLRSLIGYSPTLLLASPIALLPISSCSNSSSSPYSA